MLTQTKLLRWSLRDLSKKLKKANSVPSATFLTKSHASTQKWTQSNSRSRTARKIPSISIDQWSRLFNKDSRELSGYFMSSTSTVRDKAINKLKL